MLQHAKLHLSHHHSTHHQPPPPPSPQATLLYGVLCIQRDFPGQAAVPLDTLREACRALHAEAAVAAALPRIRSQFASLEAEVGGFLDENATGSGAQVRRTGLQASGRPYVAHRVVLRPGAAGGQGWCPLPMAANPCCPQDVQSVKASRPQGITTAAAIPSSCSTAAAPAQRRPARPPTSGSMRPGSTAAAAAAASHMPPPPPRPKQPAIYPDWWPGATEGGSSRRPGGGPVAQRRPPPRLAYSRPPTAPASVTQDDLPTAAFLLVPPRISTGRGAAEAGSGGGDARQAQQAQVIYSYACGMCMMFDADQLAACFAPAAMLLPASSAPWLPPPRCRPGAHPSPV